MLLLEAGGKNDNILINMPSALAYPMKLKRFNWMHITEPEPYMDNRRIGQHRGRGLGGSSAINGMVYVRGHAMDYDEWEMKGADGWGYRHVLPYFKRSEHYVGDADDYRSNDGPLHVNRGNDMALSPLYEAFIKAGVEAGYPATDDYNGFRQEGFGRYQMTVKDGVRWTAARAYLGAGQKPPEPSCGHPGDRSKRSCSRIAAPPVSITLSAVMRPRPRQRLKSFWPPAPSTRLRSFKSQASVPLRS